MRCSSCSKFVSYDTEVDVEVSDEEVSEDGTHLTFSARRVLNCAECGDELKEATFEFDEELTPEPVPCKDGQEHEWDVTVEATPTERRETKDRHGKPIKQSRYQTQYYGVEGNYSISCTHCEALYENNFSDEMSASSMDELQ
jgi:hypothetical protein